MARRADRRLGRTFGSRSGVVRRVLCAVLLASAPSIATCATQNTAAEHAVSSATVQTPPVEITELKPGKPIDRELTGGEKHGYQLSLAVGQLASIAIEHPGIDFTMRLLDGQGTARIVMESKPGEATDVLEFVADRAGVYHLELEASYPKAPAGKYRIRIGELRAASERERSLYESRRQSSEALQLYRRGAYDKAQSAAERSLELRERALGPDHPEVAASLTVLGSIYAARADYKRAESVLRRARAINGKAFGENRLETAEVDEALAQVYKGKPDFVEAERLARLGLGVREKRLGADHFLVAVSQGVLGDIFLEKGDYANAAIFSQRALELAGKSYPLESLPYQDAASRLARVYTRQGKYSSAEELFTQALHTRESLAGKNSLPVAESLTDLEGFYLLKIDNLKSEQVGLQALALKEKILGPDHLQVGLILNNLGLIYSRRNDYSTAETFYQRSLAIKERVLGPDHPLVAYTLNNLGLVYWRKDDYKKAAEFFQRTLEICEKAYGPESPDVTYPLANLGIIAKETGDYDRAEAYYKRSLAIKEKVFGKQHPQVGQVVESLAILYRDRGDYASAEPVFLRAQAITQESLGVNHPDNIRHFSNLAQLYAAKGDVANALKCLENLRDVEEKNLPLNLAAGSERQKLAYFGPIAQDLEKIISFQVQQDPGDSEARDLVATALMQRKGRVLDAMADSLGALWNRSNTDDRALLGQLKDVTAQLAALVLNGRQKLSAAEHQQQIKTLTQRREQLENEVGRRSAGYYQGSQEITLSAVQAALPGNTALVEFAVYRPFDPKAPLESTRKFAEPRYIAYVIPARGEVRWKDVGSATDIDNSVIALRQALRDPERSDVKDLARVLDEKIMRPVRVLTGDAARLLVSPDGQLDLIPFETLVDERGRYLVERFSISYLTTGRDLLRMQVSRASKSAPLVIADPAFGEVPASMLARADQPNLKIPIATNKQRSITTGPDLSTVYFAPLTGTAQEAHAIQSLFPEARVLLGAQATKAALKQADAPRILHIATHGFYLQDAAADAPSGVGKPDNDTRAIRATVRIENPLLRSGLALSGANLSKGSGEDGVLTALEAANLDLWGTKLVTLSACETGVGEVKNGEGVYGLRRSFFLAGAETLVMSLWAVNDRVTREMMTSYYTGLKHGLGRGEALRQVELAMLKRRDRQHPYYWASFIQSGDWTPLNSDRK
jgi:CHAT domain-containing protein/Tfp pilus assembly protein PilF